MKVGDKVLVEAVVTQMGETVGLAITGAQRVEHVRVRPEKVRGVPGRKPA